MPNASSALASLCPARETYGGGLSTVSSASSATCVAGLVEAGHETGDDERLRLRTALGQPALHEQDVEALLRCRRVHQHPPSRARTDSACLWNAGDAVQKKKKVAAKASIGRRRRRSSLHSVPRFTIKKKNDRDRVPCGRLHQRLTPRRIVRVRRTTARRRRSFPRCRRRRGRRPRTSRSARAARRRGASGGASSDRRRGGRTSSLRGYGRSRSRTRGARP